MVLSERAIEELAGAANLRLDKDRIRLLTTTLREFLADLRQMDELDLGEEPLQLVLQVRRRKE